MTPVVYDTGALIAADRGDRAFWVDHRLRLEADVLPLVPAPVVAQASRSARQAQLRQLLRGCDVVVLTEPDAHRAGHLLGRARRTDVVDAVVADLAAHTHADVVTSDREDIHHLLHTARSPVRVIDV